MNLRTTLLRHQEPAVTKLIRSRIGALFMEQGTGKTRTAIEMAHIRQAKIDCVVWFCPVSCKETIAHEIIKHTDASESDIHVFNGKTRQGHIPKAFWYVVGIESVSASNRVVLAVNDIITENTYVILDESTYIKNHRSRRTKRITLMAERCRYRTLLTGTPITEGVVDLFAQMKFLSPKILGYNSFHSFARNHLEYHPDKKGLIVRSHNTAYIASKIHPYTYQVTKKECLDLPSKLYDARYFSMSDQQRWAYEEAKEEILSELYDAEFPEYVIFRLFTVLQQITCGFWNRRQEDGSYRLHTYPHIRLDMLADTIASAPKDDKYIIWAKYRHDIDQIGTLLGQEYGPGSAAFFYGDLSEKARNEELVKFRQNDGSRFLVATTQCGGHGLTLNEAHRVIFYSNEFKYANRVQAEDRNHRIGQSESVLYTDLICRKSIDERIEQAIARKESAVHAFKREVDRVKDKSKKEVAALIKSL